MKKDHSTPLSCFVVSWYNIDIIFLSSFAQKKHFEHHGKSKSGQGHQRSSSANFQKVYFFFWFVFQSIKKLSKYVKATA